jgi:succinate dehydrogenase/fumarate reductase flavoprotein subunit
MVETAARELVVAAGRVVGVRGECRGQALSVRARRGVVLASGGFEWNPDGVQRFLGGRITHPNSPPVAEGDGLKMAMAVGADLAHLSEAWWCPSVRIPGEHYDGRPLHRADFAMHALPHAIIVNRRGERFVNEACNYHDLIKACFTFDPVAYEPANLPAWLIVDQQFLQQYLLVTLVPGLPTPDWVVSAPSLAALAARVGIDAAGLARTVERFNGFCTTGVDVDFRRGESLYDRFCGDPQHGLNPNLGALLQAPFHALPLYVGTLGTKGGPRVDAQARVLHVDGPPIPGLYAAGNVMASIMAAGYPGAGSTLGVAMTFGWIAGRHAAQT